MRTALGRLGNALLWVTATLGATALVATAALALTRTRPVVVQSGSMVPTYGVRSVVLVHRVDPTDIRAGDVVALTLPGGQHVLHRIVDVDRSANGVIVRTKGDANREPDTEPVLLPAHAAAWRAGASLPAIGGVVVLLRTPLAGFLLALALLAPLALGRSRRPASTAPAPA